MLKHKDHFHGSDLEKIEQIYGIRKEDIVSFSANVNPLGISPGMKQALSDHLDAVTSYPDREYASLRRRIAAYVRSDFENIIVGNGSTELISLFIQIERPKKAIILGPTYSEYEREIFLGGGAAHYFPLKEKDEFRLNLSDFTSHLDESVDLLVICNPNNPTSSSITREEMRQILDVCKQYDIFVMADETYAEFAEHADEISSIPLTRDYNNIIILRGTAKFFAAPGLRLGYAVTGNRDLIKSMKTRQNPWTINSLAVIAGELMFSDEDYVNKTRELICSERKRIYKILQDSSVFKPYPPSANFLLARILKEGLTSEELFERAIRQGMMIRDCSTFPFLNQKYIRFCFMMPEENDRLLACLLQDEN